MPARLLVIILAAIAFGAGPEPVAAQTSPLEQLRAPYELRSGELRSRAHGEEVVFSQLIDAGDVPWVRVLFSQAELARGSRLELRAVQDGAVQHLDATSLVQWGNTSAYFNGGLLQLTVVAGPDGAPNRIEIDELLVGLWQEGGIESQCGPTDDRVAANEPERARLLDVGCTAWIFNTDSCFATAGHCLSSASLVDVVEFNVPPSLANGTIQHPGPQDQYVPTSARQFVNGGTGNDWGIFKVFPNTEPGLLPYEAQGAHLTLASSLPGTPSGVQINGYGVDSGADNQTQQVSVGPMIAVSGNRLDYRSDTEGGNSGSGVVSLPAGQAIGIHTHGGCNSGGGQNSGTAITHPNLQAAIQDLCPTAPDALGCEDVVALNGRCLADTRLAAWVRLDDANHAGDTVTISIDGVPQTATVNGEVGFYIDTGFTGTHSVALDDPAGCGLSVEVVCP